MYIHFKSVFFGEFFPLDLPTKSKMAAGDAERISRSRRQRGTGLKSNEAVESGGKIICRAKTGNIRKEEN